MKLAPFVAIVLGIILIISVLFPTVLFPKPASAYYSSIEFETRGLYGPPKASIIPVQVNLTALLNTPCEPFSSSVEHMKLRYWPMLNFTAKATIEDVLRDFDSSLQLIQEDSSKDVKYDQYSVRVDRMPAGLTPEEYLSEMANDMNKAVNNEVFDDTNEFYIASKGGPSTLFSPSGGTPSIGTIYDIDIKWADNGSVVMVDKTATSFTVQTIARSVTSTGNHPESGVRQFGFTHNNDGSVTFYTNGVSQVDIRGTDIPSGYFQNIGWTALMN